MTARLPMRLAALALVAFAVLGMGRAWGGDSGPSCSVAHGDHR